MNRNYRLRNLPWGNYLITLFFTFPPFFNWVEPILHKFVWYYITLFKIYYIIVFAVSNSLFQKFRTEYEVQYFLKLLWSSIQGSYQMSTSILIPVFLILMAFRFYCLTNSNITILKLVNTTKNMPYQINQHQSPKPKNSTSSLSITPKRASTEIWIWIERSIESAISKRRKATYYAIRTDT